MSFLSDDSDGGSLDQSLSGRLRFLKSSNLDAITPNLIRGLVDETTDLDEEHQKTLITIVAEKLLNQGQPSTVRHLRPGQLDSIHRIVYRKGDTLLVARTGYGKSIVFQASYILLPGRVTVQIVPLVRLAAEQEAVIKTYPNAVPIVLDATVRKVQHHPLVSVCSTNGWSVNKAA